MWDAINAQHDLDAVQQHLLVLACRQKDRLDLLNRLERTSDRTWALLDADPPIELVVADPGPLINAGADAVRQLLGALRLPDARGRRPQRHGSNRGVYVMGGLR